MSVLTDRDWLISEVRKRAPWYQRIEFPQYGVTTTDDPGWGLQDAAWDNAFPGVDVKRAAQFRPVPKFERFQAYLPEVRDKTVLEVGTSCGFFVFEFCRRGAKFATGLELDERNVERAQFCARVLGIRNAHFIAGDLGDYDQAHDIVWGSSLHEHFVFPFYYLARLLCLSKEKLVLETHHYVADDSQRIARLDLNPAAPELPGSHGFHFSRPMFRDYLGMLGIGEAAQREDCFYEDGTVRRLLLSVDTREFQRSRRQSDYLRPLRGIR